LREARAAAKARPGDPSALEAWGKAAFRAGELREARRAASAWALHDAGAGPRILTAQILESLGRRADAVATLSEWLESHPESSEARADLARLTGARDPRELARR
jgi:predicted Zn-dependent protease